MIEEGQEIEVNCHFCNSHYKFSVEELDALYIPGIYTTELILGNQSIDVEVIVDKNSITSIRMVNLNDAITTMYPTMNRMPKAAKIAV